MDRKRSTSKLHFPALRYANCWEDALVLCAALRPGPTKRILSIASGGDNSFSLAAEGAEVVAVDVNPSQLACAELKRAAIQHLSHDEVLGFFGFRPQGNRQAVFQRLKSGLSHRAQSYWSTRPKAIEIGFAHSGKFEAYFSKFRRWVLPLVHRRQVIRDAMVKRNRDEREAFYREVWDNKRWQMLFRLFFSRAVMGAIGRDRETFKHVEGKVADLILERARRAFVELPPHTNPFMEYIWTGTFDRSLPHYLEPERFDAVKEGMERVTFVEGLIEDVTGTCARDGFDGFNLSDIFEYLNEDASKKLHRQLVDSGRSGARIAYWNMLVPRRLAPWADGQTVDLTEFAERLHATDRAFFYGDFILEEIRG